MTADAEFLLSKAKYKATTGREQRRDADVLCYQIRQSFKPGEITPEEANRVGYETVMRWTKGKHAFFVATHTDKAHIHNHIYYNPITLDCTRKYRDFFRSASALRRLSDRVCLENDLSVIVNPKLHSKGRFLHYGQWIGERPPSAQQRLRVAIGEALTKKPADFEAFLRLMAEAGYAVKYGRGGVISFLVPGQDKPTRLRASTLGEGYDPADIRAVIAGERPAPALREEAPPPQRINLIIDIQERLRSGKGPGYERWAKVYNLKQMAAALQYLREHELGDYATLEAATTGAVDRFHALAGELRETEVALAKSTELMAAVVDYSFITNLQMGLQQLSSWVLWNGVLASLFTALALGHPLTVLAAFVSAPITSIDPLLACGWITGLVEATIRKPTVEDVNNVPEDIFHITRFFKNRFLRALSIVFFSNIGSAIGTFIAGTDMIRNMF